MMEDSGLSPKTIEKIEAKLECFTFEGVIERLDSVFNKKWSFRFEGPHLIQVPTKVPKNPRAKNPQAFVHSEIPHWQCTCSISIALNDLSDITREYSVLVIANDEGSFAVARDLSLILAAYYGFGVGKNSNIVLEDLGVGNPIKLDWGLSEDELAISLKEFNEMKLALGIKHNLELDSYVRDFSGGELVSWKNITRSNIKDFNSYLKEKVNNGKPAKSR